jgi:DNA-binding transcriptional ArsR family regulator
MLYNILINSMAQSKKILTDEELDTLAKKFKVLSEPSRLRILRCLTEGERCVNDIINSTGLLQANVSKQLKILHDSGILDSRAQGLQRFYCVKDFAVVKICHVLCEVDEKKIKK